MIMLDYHDARTHIPLLDRAEEEFFVWEVNGAAHITRYKIATDKSIIVATGKIIDKPRYFFGQMQSVIEFFI